MTAIPYTPRDDELGFTFGGRAPVLKIRAGDVVTVYTEDCFGGAVRSVDDLPSKVCRTPYLNPVTGPFQVENAEPGDTLAVHMIDISPATGWGVSATFPHFGALTATHTTAMLHPPLPERVWWYPIDRAAGTVRFEARASDYTMDMPLDPMIGTIGVAPDGGQAITTITGDVHGGNLDTTEIRAGVTLYLPVFVPGALLSLGDGHARQGQGEICGVAVEIATETTFTVEVIKGVQTPTPRVETDAAILSIGAARPLEDAARISHADLVGWTGHLTGLDELDALQLVSQAGTAPVGNLVDPAYTMLARIPKVYLKGAAPYGGVHARLRDWARKATVDVVS